MSVEVAQMDVTGRLTVAIKRIETLRAALSRIIELPYGDVLTDADVLATALNKAHLIAGHALAQLEQ